MNQPITVDETTNFEQLFWDYLTGQLGNEQGYYSYPGFLEIVDLHRSLGAGAVRDRLEAAILALLEPGYHHPQARRLPLTWYGPNGEEIYADVDKDDWSLQWYAVAWSQALKLRQAVPLLERLVQSPYYQGSRPDQEYVRGYAENVIRELRGG